MKQKTLCSLFFSLIVATFLVLSSQVLGLDKLRFATGFWSADYNLVMWAAEEQGIWRQNGLEVEWVPLNSTGILLRAAAAGSLEMGAGRSESTIIALARGVPAVIVAGYLTGSVFDVYVRSDSPLRQPVELRGTKIGLSNIGDAGHASAQYLIKALGLAGQVKFVGVGGAAARIAALKRGHVDAIVQGTTVSVELIARGEIRSLVSSKGYLPKEWLDNTIFATKSFLASKPEIIDRTVKAHFQAMDFSKTNRAWTLEKLKAGMGYSQTAAEMIYDIYFPTGEKKRVGSPEALRNILNFLVEYGLIKKEGLPSLEAFYGPQFVQ